MIRTKSIRCCLMRASTLLVFFLMSTLSIKAAAPQTVLEEVPTSDVQIDDAFWSPRLDTCRDVTLPYCFEMCEKTGRMDNFVKAAGKMPGKFEGAHFNDSDVYKIVEGAAWELANRENEKLERQMNRAIELFAAAQQPDGYLDTFFTIDRRDQRFQHIYPNARHELYCMGHLIEAGSTHFQLTGRRTLLDVATKLADHLDATFGPGQRSEVPEHQELELALIKLSRVTDEPRYRKLAEFFIEGRGDAKGHKLYGANSQDHLPIRRQSEIVGHAVRAMYNTCGVADLYMENGDQELLAALRRLWESTTHRKMYVTGGVGATRQGEAFGGDYQLPNRSAYAETCAQIGLLLFAQRMVRIDPDAQYADVMERVLYNGFLSGLSLSGDRFFYQNRLESRGEIHRQPWFGCACCPSNVVRIYPQLGRFIYTHDDDSLNVNLYLANKSTVAMGNRRVMLEQKTDYPWSGCITIRVTPEKGESRFTLRLRIPGWCRDEQTPGGLYRWKKPDAKPTLSLNGQPLELGTLEKGYVRLERDWQPGDTVELNLPMPIRRVYAHARVSADKGRVAIQRGPIVYCVEAIDHEKPIEQFILPPTATLSAEHRDDLLGGVTVIRGKALVPSENRSEDKGSNESVDLLAVPYSVWDNREPGAMAVWLVEDPEASAPMQTAQWVGTNYTPAYCVNQVQLWHDFQPKVIERELAAASKYFGINTLRVYLHNIPFDAEKATFLANIEQFLTICDRHGIRPGFTFFDDCHRKEGIFLETPTEPIKGYHNGRWAACPQARERTEENLPKFKAYVQETIRAHREDPRVLWWEIFNEPNRRDAFSSKLRKRGYAWAKEVEPRQPVLCCWDDSPETDIVDAHNYSNHFDRWARQIELNESKGCVFTEAGARWYAPRPSNGEPCEVIHWLGERKSAGLYVPGVYLCWELMVGNSNCRWYWGTPENTPEPTVPWCGLLWPDATPVSLAEAEAIKRWTTGKSSALFFDDFQNDTTLDRPGWSTYRRSTNRSGVMQVEPGVKRIVGDPAWTDYVLETRVMLRGKEGNAGLVFRVNDPGPGYDEMRGYYVGLDTEKLYLGKMENRWQPLAEFELSNLDCKVVPGVWNQIRVAVTGPRIRVWLNRMHPSADKDAGLRLDVTDSTRPILSGAVGVRAHQVSAWFDNLIVMPIE